MSINEKVSKIKKALDIALCMYSSENIDLVRDEANDAFRVMYHSDRCSFMVDDNFEVPFDKVTASMIIPELDKLDVGYCW